MLYNHKINTMVQYMYDKERRETTYNNILTTHNLLTNNNKNGGYVKNLSKINEELTKIQKLKDIKDIIIYIAMNKFNLTYIDDFNNFLIDQSKLNLTPKNKDKILKDIYAVFYGELISDFLLHIYIEINNYHDQGELYDILELLDFDKCFSSIVNEKQNINSEYIVEMEYYE